MRDMHCHILPGVDDGAKNLDDALAMLQAAKEAGVTSIVCTPHCRDPYFNYEAMWDAFELLVAHADGFPLQMGFEVNHAKLMELGFDWVDRLAFQDPGSVCVRGRHAAGPASAAGGGASPAESREFLLELSSRCTEAHFAEYERTIFELQGRGYTVIIAHPERYRAIQENTEIARNLVKMGCKLQASADFVAGGRLGKERKPAKRLFEENLYSYLASDAHCVEHYGYLAQARQEYRTRGAHARL